MKNQYLKPKYLKCILLLLIFAVALKAHAQVTIMPAKENFTHFSAPKSCADLEKLKAITPASFQSNPDFGKCFTTHTNWYEQIDKRTPRSRSYINDSGQVITEYGYDNINYTDSKGWLRAVDSKLKPAGNGWAATQQENPTYLYKDASTALSVGNDQLITFNKNVQFNSTAINAAAFTVGDNGIMIKNVVTNTDKVIHFKRNTIETDYLINKPLNLSGDLIISEDILLPAGFSIIQENISLDEDEAGSLAIIGPDNKEKAVLKVPACYDNAKNEIIGSYHIIKQNGGYRLEIIVPSSWINSSSRSYPITIDPVVTGTTAKWAGGKIASCVYPSFGSGSMDVTIPAGITITGFYIQSSYYANPLKSEPLDDALVYFGTKCGSTGYSSINGLKGDSSGIGTFSLTDFHSSLACCMHPSCSAQTIDLTMYLSRTAGGNSCDSQYIYYDPANTDGYNFEAYIVGNTVELNNSTWAVSPTLTCGNDCSLTLTATINYGVPPYTISHPWAGSSVTVGKYDTAICGSTGSATITLTIPNCPLTSCTATLLSVPPPTIIDACGTSVQGLTNQFITVKPVPTVVATPDSVETCSGSSFNISLTSCVSGTTFSWSGSDGSSGSGSTIKDSMINASGSAKIVDFTITPSAGGCTGNPVVIKATIEPIPTSPFTIDPSKVCVNANTAVTYSGTKINGAVYNWNFGGGTLVSGSATGPGPDSISFATTGSHTITLSVTANGCTSTTTSNTVTVIPGPVITVSPSPADICFGNSVKLSASGGNVYAWSPSTGLTSTTGSSTTASPVSSTVYSVTGSSAATGCSTTVKDSINVNAKPIITANPSPASYCAGGSSTLTASGGKTYTWSPSTGLSATTGGTVIASPATTTKYVVTGTNAGGCSSTDTVTVTVNPKPIITATPSPASYCPGGSSTLTASGGITYTWSPSTGLSATTGTTVTANPTITTTYIVTGTNSNGCSATGNVTVTVNTKPVITVDPSPADICNGTSALLSASGGTTYTWSPSTSLSATTGSSVSANPVSTTVYIVTGTGANGCVGTATDSVKVGAKPVITANPNPASYCSGGSSTLTASGGKTYTWSPATGLSATTGGTVTANPTITTKYVVTGTNANGCSATDTVIVTVNSNPIVNVSPGSSSYCPGGSSALSASGGTTYTWTPSTGLSATTGNSVTADPTITTTYYITVTNSSGCKAKDSAIVIVKSKPVIVVDPSPATVCSGSPALLTASGASTYTWSPSTSLSSTTGSSVSANPASTTVYIVTGTGANGCTATMTDSVKVNAKPSVIVKAVQSSICNDSSTILTASGAKTYTWSPSTGLSATTGSSVKTILSITTTYTVIGSNASGCEDTATITITVIKPVLTVTPNNPAYCIGSNTTLTASGLNNYTWTPATGLNSSTGSTVIADPTVSSTYTVTATNAIGCHATTTITLTVNKNPKGSVTPKSAAICDGSSTTLAASGAGYYFWSPSTGLSSSTGDSVIVNPVIPVTYTVIGVDSNGCKDTTTVPISIKSLPVITATPSTLTTCYGDSVSLHAKGGNTYAWSPASGLSSTSDSSAKASPLSTIRYIVTGTDTSSKCSDTASVLVKVTPGPVVTVSPSKPELCLGDTLNLLASGALTYTWSPSLGLSCTACSNPIDSSTVTSKYIVQGTASTGCKSFDTVIVKVDTPAKLTVSKDTFVCQGQAVQLSATSSNGTLSWSPSTGLSCSTCNDPIASPSGNTTYFVSAVNGACSVSDSITVTVGVVSLSVGPDQHISYGQSAQLAATGTKHYSWTPASTLDNDTSSIPVATPVITTTYYVTGNNGQGCSVTDTVVVFVSGACESLKVPTGFLPDGGEPNNYLHILGFNGVQLNTFQVFNRWGQMVYQTADINDRGWDGTFDGKPQPMGTYVYYAEVFCEGRTVHMRGNVTLIR